jgi:uncharacterized protein (TIGR02594 family)
MKSVLAAVAAWALLLVLLQPARADESAATFFLRDQARHSAPQLHETVWNTGRVIARGFKKRGEQALESTGNALVAEASRFLGSGNFTGSHRAWCADAVNAWLARTGHRTTGSGAAISFAKYGAPLPGPQVGAIMVHRHHVAIVTKVLGNGRVQTISGNWSKRVKMATVSTRGAVAFRRPV